MFTGKNILLIISGGIAAYKALELIRLLKKNNANVRCILTQGGEKFITPLSVSSLSGNKVYTDLWSLTDETEMGHIRLSRENDLILVAPASANILAKLAHGLADDLASTTLLASDKPIMVAPAMNPTMWESAATKSNIETLMKRGVFIVGPASGDMACGETGKGRLCEPDEIIEAIKSFFFKRPLKGLKALVTSGPTHEPIDPVRFLGNRSSGKQGHAIAAALRDAGADVTLISGPVSYAPPAGIQTINIQTADQMYAACEAALPVDIAICAAAVSDWTVTSPQNQKIKKQSGTAAPVLELKETPDILKNIARHKTMRPALVIGFAAETQKILEHANDKLASKGCDWIIANNVSEGKGFGKDENKVTFITAALKEDWPLCSKNEIAKNIVEKIIKHFNR